MKDINYIDCHRKITFKVLLTDFVEGLFRYKYPLCCVLQFIWENCNGVLSAKTRKEKYDLDNEFLLKHFECVPCNKCIEKYLKENKNEKT